ncbi:DUF2971 domain-containing protein [Leisingera sp.]|uniref:DUF2971 domain-containing protein n=1 Tax=Leisingera sp. TaxID=1879318 RepID=UPI002B267C73|nr:DUF2971 domain-containing protein [Leisingera sp.]
MASQEAIPLKTDLLWHYTTFQTFRRIVESQSLLARDYRLLNDGMEIKLGAKWVTDWLGSQEEFDFGNVCPEYFIQQYQDFEDAHCPFVISFSAARDRLSMWRGYADAVHGSDGIAIGFDRADLIKIALASRVFGPEKVAYDREAFEEILASKIRQGLTKFGGWQDYLMLKDIPPFVKSSTFAEEEEWRIVDPNPYLARQRMLTEIGGEYRSVLSLNACDEPLSYKFGIREVLVGPKGNKAAIDNYVRVALQGAEGVQSVTVRKSEIPFI